VIARHVHARPYATIVLEGGYEEAGDHGRFRVAAGDVLFHGAFSAHQDVISMARTVVLDLPLPMDLSAPARGGAADLDAVVALAERDRAAASELLVATMQPLEARELEPADELGAALVAETGRIGAWSAAHGLVRETLSRHFRQLYGVDAARFRGEARARRAWRLVVDTELPLVEIAAITGHADQPHMTRAVRALTGRTPGAWRRVTSLQDPGGLAR
jgi:AraC-like DNA-binding protein